MKRVLVLGGLLMFAGCAAPPVTDAGCATYGARRVELPRPVEEGALARWVAVTDAAMTGACW